MKLRAPKVEFLPDAAAASRGDRSSVPWYERLRGFLLKKKTPASRGYRYMARLIEREFGGRAAGVSLGFSAPDGDKITSDALLMLAYCLRSELDGKVLIIDARLKDRAAGITGRLGLLESRGFFEILREGFAGNEHLIQSTTVPDVDVLPAGAPRGEPAMPMHRDKLGQLLGAAKARYGYVLVQVGSVLSDTRNLVIAAGTDAVFVVVGEDTTFMKTLDDCRNLLLANGVGDVRVIITGGEP